MEERSVEKIVEATHWPRTMAAWALGMLALFLLVATLGELKGLRYIGEGITPSNTITVAGEGIVYAVPDTAEFTVTVQSNAADVATAQTKATTAGNAIINYLEQQGVTSADIQTTDYEINPQYSYSQSVCTQPAVANGYVSSVPAIVCPPSGNQLLTGYQVSQTLSVKVSDTSKAGTLLSGVGKLGASQVSGLSFTVADQDALQTQAQNKAIADAQSKAQALAKSLGVSLVQVVGFSDNSAPAPMPYRVEAMASGASAVPAPQIPTGQNTITSDVSITYEIQ